MVTRGLWAMEWKSRVCLAAHLLDHLQRSEYVSDCAANALWCFALFGVSLLIHSLAWQTGLSEACMPEDSSMPSAPDMQPSAALFLA